VGIPKRIIQTGKNQYLSLLERAAVVNLKLLNPDFEYLFFDDAAVETFIGAHFPQYQAVFDHFAQPIQKYDFFRYLAVYHYGGFYVDLDVMLAKSLSDLCEHTCVFPFEELSLHRFLREVHGMDWEIGNYAFAATAQHPFIGAIIENCVKAQRNPAWAEVMWRAVPRLFRDSFYVLDTTGPGLVSRTLAEFDGVAEHVHVLFPVDVCDATKWHQFGDYGVHLQAGSWRKKSGLIKRRLSMAWTERTRAQGFEESSVLGPDRKLDFSKPGR
jgi:inositol phosphorylceramide mannosyltransferase catalytic subunit